MASDDELKRLFETEANIESFRADLIHKAAAMFEKNKEQIQKHYDMLARLSRMKYDALLKAGYTEAQALYLLKRDDES